LCNIYLSLATHLIYNFKTKCVQTVLGKFIDVFVGYPGSCHDAYVWPLYQKLSENSDILIPKNHYILGDSAYPLTDYLIKPYRNNWKKMLVLSLE